MPHCSYKNRPLLWFKMPIKCEFYCLSSDEYINLTLYGFLHVILNLRWGGVWQSNMTKQINPGCLCAHAWIFNESERSIWAQRWSSSPLFLFMKRCRYLFKTKTGTELRNCFNENGQSNSYLNDFTVFNSVKSDIKAAHYILLIRPRLIDPDFKI